MSATKIKLLVCLALLCMQIKGEDDLKDFEFEPEIMIAQESRQYQTIVKPPFKMPKHVKIVKPNGITNSHRPQYNIDSEEDFNKEYLADLLETSTKRALEKSYRPSYKLRSKEAMIREAVLRALDRKDHVGKFAQIVPIIRSMSGTQRVALASLVASQVTTPPGRTPLNLAQVRSMFGNDANTSSELMLPILLDMANLIRKAVRPGKDTREVRVPHTQMLRRSIEVDEEEEDDTLLNDEPFETYDDITTTTTTTQPPRINKSRGRNTRVRATQATPNKFVKTFRIDVKANTVDTENIIKNTSDSEKRDQSEDKNATKHASTFSTLSSTLHPSTSSSTTETASSLAKPSSANRPRSLLGDNVTMDLAAESTNQTLAQDLPVAEKLRSFNRYVDRKGNVMRRGNFPKPAAPAARRTTAEPSLGPLPARRRPPPGRKIQGMKNGVGALLTDDGKCELFTNSLCLHAEDYPTDLIVQSIRRNKAAAGALLADFKDPGDGAVDGVTAQQEAKYTADHYLVSNRRGDTASRDFAGAGEAGFMCPSTVKYARPQRARATSGQWKYIVNTGEHTQTLRLEKCLKPKESCTYLTDNFKSKCVQVYNYHRLLTWDQQNGLHMDIFKVPTCCSCHIEGYSVAFPPLGHRAHESSSETLPGDDLSSEHGNGAFESVQSTMQRPSVTKRPPFGLKPLETFPSISENHNLISGSGFPSVNMDDGDDFHNRDLPPTSPMDSYGNSYFPDSFNQPSNIRNVKRPLKGRNPTGTSETMDGVTLPSYLEPPTPSAGSSFSFVKEPPSKYKITSSNQFKRGAPTRPNRRPIRKKISGVPDDLVPSGTSAVDVSSSHIETLEDFNDDLEEPDVLPNKKLQNKVTIAPKLPSAESSSTTARPEGKKPNNKENIGPNGKRVNYNYHPIIDFFEEDKEDASIDREDAVPEYSPAVQSDWKPIDHPANRNGNSNLAVKKKH